MTATLDYNPTAARRPFRVHYTNGVRSYSTFSAAVTAARFAMRQNGAVDRWPTAAETRPPVAGNPLTRPTPVARVMPDPSVVDVPSGVYRIQGFRGGVLVARDVTARGRSAAIRSFLALTGADRIKSTRHLSRRNPLAKGARVRKQTAMLSAKRRAQRSNKETAILRRAIG